MLGAPSVGAAQPRVLLRPRLISDAVAGRGHRLQPGLGDLPSADLAKPVPARIQPGQCRFDSGELGSHPHFHRRVQLPVQGIGGLLGRELVGPDALLAAQVPSGGVEHALEAGFLPFKSLTNRQHVHGASTRS
jgi:hypothetical protein